MSSNDCAPAVTFMTKSLLACGLSHVESEPVAARSWLWVFPSCSPSVAHILATLSQPTSFSPSTAMSMASMVMSR